MIYFLYSCFSSFWVFCFAYIMFFTAFTFSRFKGEFFPYETWFHLFPTYLFRGLFPLVPLIFVLVILRLLITALGKIYSLE